MALDVAEVVEPRRLGMMHASSPRWLHGHMPVCSHPLLLLRLWNDATSCKTHWRPGKHVTGRYSPASLAISSSVRMSLTLPRTWAASEDLGNTVRSRPTFTAK